FFIPFDLKFFFLLKIFPTMKPITSLLLIILLGLGLPATAQKLKLQEGDLSLLSAVKKMNVIYDYSSMAVGKFDREADYIAKKKGEYNKKESGKGDAWEQNWIEDRATRYQPQFEELFNKHGKIELGNYPQETYTMIVKTSFVEPGYNIAISRKNAEIDGEIRSE